MYDHTLHHGKKHFCCSYLQTFSGKQRIIMPKKGEYDKFKIYERKIKFTIYNSYRF